MNKWLFIALLVTASTANAANNVHKCRAPDGKVVYTDKGCPQGQDVGGRDHESNAASQADAGNAGKSGRENYYREQVKSAEQSAPKPERPDSARP